MSKNRSLPANNVFSPHLQYKQGLVLRSRATEILYGGAAGGGKSYLLRIYAILAALMIPGIQIYLFRRTFPDLIKNHMEGPKGFRALLMPFVGRALDMVGEEVRFYNGSRIHLCHCQHEKDVAKYQGAEIHLLLIDELTHFTENIYRFLRGRLRKVGLAIPPPAQKLLGNFPKIICGTNPGSIGHMWVKRTFIEMCEMAGEVSKIVKVDKSEGGLHRQYIPAMLEDNPALLKEDPDYEERLEGLGTPDLVRAMRYGLWDITAGAALEKINRNVHMLRPFTPPQHWTKFMVIDWGTYRPFSVGWYCVAGEDAELSAKGNWAPRVIPQNAIVRYRELYGWNGRPNEGCRLEPWDVTQQILDIEEEAGEMMDFRVGDSSMWNKTGGPSVAEYMEIAAEKKGCTWVMEKSLKDRENNYQEIRQRLVGYGGAPMLYVTADCKHWWRTVPDLQLDELHYEKGPDTDQEDHCYDDMAYACAARPLTIKKHERERREYDEKKAKHVKRYKTY